MDEPATATTYSGPARATASRDPVELAGPAGEILRPGTSVGRYVVMSHVGSGGMGRVYAAFDPELDRKVALKLLRAERDDEAGRSGLVGEARALAKLAHPHVVNVFDVGVVDDQVFVAMEYIAGVTLRRVLAERSKGWRQVLRLLVPVAEGLVAIHAAGLVHRDLKPDNMMLGDDGRVRVMDFGLARASRSTAISDEVTMGRASTLEAVRTRTGAWQGTPAYMAPEQWRGEPPDARTDQFAYCVTLWEALYGERPFAGSTIDGIERAVLAGRRREPPRGRRVPRWLRRVCERGLATRPEQRFDSMQALLGALARGHTLARMRTGLLAAGVVALGWLGGEGWQRWQAAQQLAACEATGEEITEAWNDARRRALHDALLATGVSHAAATAERVMPSLDRSAEAWRVARVEACLDAEVRDRWSAEQLDRSLWCLDERKLELASLVDALTDADAKAVQNAAVAAADLSPVESCRDERVLELLGLPRSEQRTEIRAVREDLARVLAVQRTGRYDQGLTLARDALARAEAVGWLPLVATARLRVGSLLSLTGSLAEAESALEDAHFDALRATDPRLLVATSLRLVHVVGYKLARPADGQRWGRFAEAAIAATGDVEQLDRASLYKSLADVDIRAGDYPAAIARYEQALAIADAVLGPEHSWSLSVLSNLASARTFTGGYAEALALYERVLAVRTQVQGPEHPDVGEALHNVAHVEWQMGAYDEAEARYERALAIRSAALGPEHPDTAQTLDNLAALLITVGRHDEARALSERALAIHEARLGAEHPTVATSLTILASIDLARGDLQTTRARCDRARSIFEARLGPEHPSVATPLMCLSEVALVEGRVGEAIPLLERALTVRERSNAPGDELEEARFMLAKARWDAPEAEGRDREAAIALAERARNAHREAGRAEALAEVERWLAEHRSP